MKLRDKYNEKVDIYFDKINYPVAQFVGSDKKVLDVGCSVGKLGKYLKKYKNAEVYGIDISNKAIQKAKKILDGAYAINIEEEKLAFKKNSFDTIICADILEHLYDPLATVQKLKKVLKDDGVFIISIPNIANIKIRWDLLRGRFDYANSGIMDNTHIRFFTKKSVEQLIADAGLTIKDMDYTVGFSFFLFKDGFIKDNKFLQRIRYRLNTLIPTLTCTQFIIVASRKK